MENKYRKNNELADIQQKLMVHMPTTPPPVGPGSPQGAQSPAQPPDEKNQLFDKPFTFLGMKFDSKDAAKLWQAIFQAVGHEIDKDKQKMVETLRKIREEENQ
jgi:hypothetical protein